MLGFTLLSKLGKRKAYISEPTWFGHEDLIQERGFELASYPYYSDHKFTPEAMMERLRTIETGSIVVIQAAGHNPSGHDLTHEHWKELALILKERNLIAMVDFAYQGFASGDLEEDAWGVRYLLEEGLEFLVA